MNESLLDKIIRLERELKELQSIKPVKQVDYSEGILLLEQVNKELNKRFFDLDNKYSELNNKINLLNDKINKPVVAPALKVADHSKDLASINEQIRSINQTVNKKQDTDLRAEIEKVVNQIVNKPYINNIYRNK